MKNMLIVGGLALALGSVVFAAGKQDEEALIKLDEEWGAAGADSATVARILADSLISVDSAGVVGKKEVLAADPGPAAQEPYSVDDYKVQFLNDDTAVMVHSVGGAVPHWSMHVWVKRDGRWQVAASSSTPAGD